MWVKKMASRLPRASERCFRKYASFKLLSALEIMSRNIFFFNLIICESLILTLLSKHPHLNSQEASNAWLFLNKV